MARSSRRLTLSLVGLIVATVLAGLVVAYVRARGPEAKDLPNRPLRDAAALSIGTAVDDLALQREPGYREVLAEQFSSLTPENVMKWGLVEPERGRYDWAGGDRLLAFARRHGQLVRGHTLLWWNQLPRWVSEGEWTRASLQEVVRGHIRRVTERWPSEEWDVVNEPLDERGRLRDDLFSQVLGAGWVEDAFRAAHRGAPDSELYLNETAADGLGPKSDGLFRLVRDLVAREVPIDGVGLQAHLNLDGVPKGFEENLRRFKDLGLEVAITELDVALGLPASAKDLRAQARIYAEVARTCRRVGCSSLTVWGFTDRHSWIPGTQEGFGAATLLDEDLRPKPAYRAFQAALRG